jgi:argonaute-like protein implicated in RNA metabolism and viral defense
MPFKEGGVPPKEQNEPATFDELEKKKDVSADELIATLKDYAEGGWAINDKVVLTLIRRTKLKEDEREIIKDLAKKGAELQDARSEVESRDEYVNIIDHIDDIPAGSVE